MSEMPCPACPENCPRYAADCRPLCKTWKIWEKEHGPPRPKVTEAERYRNAQHKRAAAKLIKKGRRW